MWRLGAGVNLRLRRRRGAWMENEAAGPVRELGWPAAVTMMLMLAQRWFFDFRSTGLAAGRVRHGVAGFGRGRAA